MEPIQFIAILFALFAYSRTILRFKDKNISIREFLFWTIIWGCIILISAVPITTSWLSHIFGIERPIDIVVYASIVLLFYLLFRIYVKIESVEQDITKIIRQLAIEKKKRK